jgi:Ni/Fe-hydrogenase subunit HybB-like protein
MMVTPISSGITRSRSSIFALWLILWIALIAFGLFSAAICLIFGLNQTNMNDVFAFGLWISFDLSIIALGAGAFFTGFLTYIAGKHALKSIINLAVTIGFICYSGAVAVLGIEIGQPIRSWFLMWHANPHSMLTEVAFCISCYLAVLSIEMIPTILENRHLNKIPEFHFFAHHLHEIMFVFAATGTFLSFFHQGSLGGMFGVLYAKPFIGRPMFSVWPTTFFLFILSAMASGPFFTLIILEIIESFSRKRLVTDDAKQILAKIAARMLAAYIILKMADTLIWAVKLAPKAGFHIADFYRSGPYGWWTLIVEIGLLGILPAILLNIERFRKNRSLLIIGGIMTCAGVVLNRFIASVAPLAIPVLPFESFHTYLPSWQELGVVMGFLGYAGLVLSLAYRYLPIFPHEIQLNPAPVQPAMSNQRNADLQ